MATQVAVISDIHGNRWALAAVLADIERRGITAGVNLGDSLYGPLDPAGTADLLLEQQLLTVRGNQDRQIIEQSAGNAVSPTLAFVRDSLTSTHLEWLTSLPLTAVRGDDLLLCHGSPDRDDEYLLWDVEPDGAHRRTAGAVAARLTTPDHRVVLCGHDHVPWTTRLPDGTMVMNPGSVGLPAYTDDEPFPHLMQTGTPHAHYGVLTTQATGWRIVDVAVSYDWESAAASAERHGCPDWATWLRTGQA